MLILFFNRNFRKIALLAIAACAGLAIISTALPASQSTYAVAASQSSVVPKANCNARAEKLNMLLEASAPVIQ